MNKEKQENYRILVLRKIAVKADQRFKHTMALALNPKTNYADGIFRCVTRRIGELDEWGYMDKSILCRIERSKDGVYEIKDELRIKNQTAIVDSLNKKNLEFLGLEDPDIWIDWESKIHIYFTIPLLNIKTKNAIVHLGYASGENLSELEMTMPVLLEKNNCGAKELSIAPMNKQGFRYNLVESSDHGEGYWYSTIRVAIAKKMGEEWEFGETIFHPKKEKIAWAGGHASPGPLMPKSFIDVGEGRCLGFMNGREAGRKNGSTIAYGKFSVGLFIYNYEIGKIEWVSPEYLISDEQAKTVTFASEFVVNNNGKGMLYAHVDDSFVVSYEFSSEDLKKIIKEK